MHKSVYIWSGFLTNGPKKHTFYRFGANRILSINGFKGAFGQAGQVVLSEPQFVARGFLEGILVKFQGQLGQSLGQLAVAVTVSTL